VGFPAAQRLPHRRSVTITILQLRPAPARVLVHWAGCAPEEVTWEPLATIYDTNPGTSVATSAPSRTSQHASSFRPSCPPLHLRMWSELPRSRARCLLCVLPSKCVRPPHVPIFSLFCSRQPLPVLTLKRRGGVWDPYGSGPHCAASLYSPVCRATFTPSVLPMFSGV
jgi:hypothetical protein